MAAVEGGRRARSYAVAAVLPPALCGLLWLLLAGPLDPAPATRWGVGIGLANVALLSSTLIVLWFYTVETSAIADQGRHMAWERAQPWVVLAWEPRASPTGGPTGWEWLVKNVGQGLAVNVILVTRTTDDELPTVRMIGALPAGATAPVPEAITRILDGDQVGRQRYYALAQHAGGGPWNVSANLREGSGFVHALGFLRPTQEELSLLDAPSVFEALDGVPMVQPDAPRFLKLRDRIVPLGSVSRLT